MPESSSRIPQSLETWRFSSEPAQKTCIVSTVNFVCCAQMFRVDSFTYTAMKFPAPVCDDCAIPMVTATAIFRHGTAKTPKVTFYQCQKCGCTLGAPLGRHYRIIPPAA
jgi:hypothetical protein